MSAVASKISPIAIGEMPVSRLKEFTCKMNAGW
jgi:hypothetical protein